MIEKVNPAHPDKVADRIAGAIVDLAYNTERDPKIAVEVLIGHGVCHVVIETTANLDTRKITAAVKGIAGNVSTDIMIVPQDTHLTANQEYGFRCGDNGIFKGVPLTAEQKALSEIAHNIYAKYPYDGKYILDETRLIICQSNADTDELKKLYPNAEINPLGDWTGGTSVDTGATNRKLGSDMADSVTGGGLCLSGDSEFLSDDLKWHRIDEYVSGQKVGQYDNGQLEFVLPQSYIQNSVDNMIEFKNDSKLSMKLTPFHEVLLQTSKGKLVKHPALLVADSLLSHKGNLGKVLHTFQYDNGCVNSKYIDNNDYRLQVAFCADGTLLNNNRTWSGRIRVKRDYKKRRLRELLAGREYTESYDNEYSIFWFNPTVLSKSLYECFHKEDFTILREEIFKWDGDEKLKLFRTTIKEDADFIQFVLTSGGCASGILMNDRMGEIFGGKYTRKSIEYTVNVYSSTTTEFKESKGVSIGVHCCEEKEPSYCFTVPSHNLVIRHNNKIFITGNCGKDLSKADVSVNIYAFLKAQKTGLPVELCCAIGDDTIDGIPYSDIVETAREYIRSIGGFEKFAEWGLF